MMTNNNPFQWHHSHMGETTVTNIPWVHYSSNDAYNNSSNVDKTMSFLPPMTGNGKSIPPVKIVIWGWLIVVLPTLVVLVDKLR